jgi:predicted nucleic acid-binding protein
VIVLCDVNVVLDVLLRREPWFREAAILLSAAERGEVDVCVAGHTITTVYYLVAGQKDRGAATQAVADLLRIVRVVPLGTADFQQALLLGMGDFEDSVQVAAGLKEGAEYVVTRDARHFRASPLRPRTAAEILALL